MLRLTLQRGVAAELVQQLFAKLGRSSGFRTACDPAAYAYRAAIRLAIDWHRRRPRDVAAGGDRSVDPADDAVVDPLDAIVRREDVERLLAAMQTLTDLAREAVCLRYLAERSFEQIGEALGRTPHQARGLCADGLRQLRERMCENSKGVSRARPTIVRP